MGTVPPPEQFQGGDRKNVPPLSDSGGTEVAQGGDKKNFGRFAPDLSPPLRSSGGGQKIFRALRARFSPPELNPVSAPDCI